jgi:hypothetical protein
MTVGWAILIVGLLGLMIYSRGFRLAIGMAVGGIMLLFVGWASNEAFLNNGNSADDIRLTCPDWDGARWPEHDGTRWNTTYNRYPVGIETDGCKWLRDQDGAKKNRNEAGATQVTDKDTIAMGSLVGTLAQASQSCPSTYYNTAAMLAKAALMRDTLDGRRDSPDDRLAMEAEGVHNFQGLVRQKSLTFACDRAIEALID